ncbi:MAG: HNH endonuclease [Bryobacterales bacterium]|nr:HNH endonuclease [Bryobacterales bacterium]
MAGRRARELKAYRSKRWTALRDKVRSRAGCIPGTSVGRCERCGRTDTLAVHHKQAIADGGEIYPDLTGLEAVCRDCHRDSHHARRTSVADGDPALDAQIGAWNRLLAQ